MSQLQKITPCLWFDANAEVAVAHYLSLFDRSRVIATLQYGDGATLPKGSVMSIEFELFDQRFHALNGGPRFGFTEAVSLSVACDTQVEIDQLWAGLSSGGEAGRCGWLKDKFGVSWQIVPVALADMMRRNEPARTSRVMTALMGMAKLDIAELQRAWDGS